VASAVVAGGASTVVQYAMVVMAAASQPAGAACDESEINISPLRPVRCVVMSDSP